MRTGEVFVSIWGPWMWGPGGDVRDERAYVVLDAEAVPSLGAGEEDVDEYGDCKWLISGYTEEDDATILACAREIDAALGYSDLAGALGTVRDWKSGKWEYGGKDEPLPFTWHGDWRRREYRPDDTEWLEIGALDDDDPLDVWTSDKRPLTPEYFGRVYREWTDEVYDHLVWGPEDDREPPDEVLHPNSYYRRCRSERSRAGNRVFYGDIWSYKSNELNHTELHTRPMGGF